MEQPSLADIGYHTDKGMRRKVNEDSLAVPPADLAANILAQKGLLYVVADGIGGHTAGKEASDLAVRVVMRQYYADPSGDVEGSLAQAIQVANAEIHRQAQDPAFARMGTTIVAAVVRGNRLTVAHVGDSRIYLDRGGTMRPLTRDHSWVAEQVHNGLLTPEQASQHEQRHVLTRSLGRQVQVAVDVSHQVLQPGDRLLLCSDGLWEFVDHGVIQQVMATQPAQVAAQQLVDLANQAGGPDNITAIVVKPAVSEAQPVLAGRAAGTGRPWDQAREWYTDQPDQKQQLILVLAAALLLVGVVALAVFLFSRPLPEAPSPLVAPLRYVAQEGDTQAAIAAFFRVPAGDVPADVTAGRTLELTPGDHAIHFNGQVLQIDEALDGVALEVGSHDQRYRVRVDTAVAGMQIQEAYAPEQGNTVTVVGYPGGDNTIQALGVDVADGKWNTWYRRSPDRDLWIYSAMHKHLIPPDGDLAVLEGRQVLFLGNWTSTDSVLVFDWDRADLYVLDQDAEPAIYVPPVPQAVGTPLSTRFPSASVPSAPASTGEPAEGTPDAAATSSPDLTGLVHGTVRPSEGAKVRAGATLQSEWVGGFTQGIRFEIECQVAGEDVGGNPVWYRVSDPGFGTGYVSAANVDLDAGYTPEAIHACE